MTLQSRRRALQTADFNDAALSLKLLGDKSSHRFTYRIVIAANKCRILVRIGLPVIENHRYTFIVCTLYRLGYSTQLIRRYDKQIYALIDKLVNLLILQHIIIVGRSQFHDKRIIEILAHLQFIIQFIAPGIFRTLGYANDILPRLLSTTGQQHDDRYIYNKV